MASKRMIAQIIVDSDAFLDMPQSTQNLYFHLNIRADDDGFIDNPKKIMRTVGSNQNDIEILLSKRYLLLFDSGVIVIKHWRLHNTIQKDRYKPTVYQEEYEKLQIKDNGAYTDNKMLSCNDIKPCIQNVNTLDTECCIDKIRLDIDKDREDIQSAKKDFNLFWEAYPKKVSKVEAIKSYNKKLKVLPDINKHIEIIKNWCNTEQWKNNYIPNPTTWLNQERWNDEIVLSADEKKKKERDEIVKQIIKGEWKE